MISGNTARPSLQLPGLHGASTLTDTHSHWFYSYFPDKPGYPVTSWLRCDWCKILTQLDTLPDAYQGLHLSFI